MELSVRREFGASSECSSIQSFSGRYSWDNYLNWIKLTHLKRLRTYDSMLNPIVADSQAAIASIREIEAKLPLFGTHEPCQYLQLAINLEEERMPSLPDWIKLLGYDLVEDGYAISSLLNCGPWEGELAQFTTRLNDFGLLDLEEVRRAELLLPVVWGEDEPHAFADVWAICEVMQ